MPRQTEPNANNALGELLRGMMPGCEVRSENTQTFPDYPGRHADVLIAAPGRSPVVVEAEYEPAAEVERDASERLGLRVQGQPGTVEAAIAVRYPQVVEDAYDVRQVLSKVRLSYYVLHQDGTRFPESGWLEGSATDLADLARLVSAPHKAVEQAADTLEQGIGQAATRLDEMAKLRPNVTLVIARLLGMSDVPQTRRMACAIIANAMVFHQRIAGMHQGVKPLRLVCGPNVANPQSEALAAWDDILKINYWPIFAIAKDILEQLPGDVATGVLRELLETAQEVEATGVDNAHDLTGRIFQRLIADRKYLATFYTLPASAALLARLAVAKMDGVDWADAEAIGRLRIGDFACGTGALLSAVYEQVANHYERAGGDSTSLHPRDDGGGPVRLRRHALGHSHHRLHPVRYAAQRGVQSVPSLHHALRKAEGQHGEDRFPGVAPSLHSLDLIQYQRPSSAHWQRGRGDCCPDQRGHPGREL